MTLAEQKQPPAPPGAPPRRRFPNWLKFLARLAISLSLLGVLLARAGPAMLGAARDVELGYLAGAFGVALLGIAVGVWKWGLMLAQLGIRLPFLRLLRLYWIGMFYNNFLPTAAGGDVVRVLIARAELGGHTVELAAATIGERVTGLLALCLLGVGALASVDVPGLTAGQRHLLAGVGLSVVVGIAWVLVRPGWFAPSVAGEGWTANVLRGVQKLRQALAKSARGSGQFTAIMAISVFRQALVALMVFLVSLAAGLSLPAALFFVLVPLMCLIWMAPIAVNGVGVREWSFVYFFGPLGVPEHRALLISLLTWVVLSATMGIGGIVQAFGGRTGNRSR